MAKNFPLRLERFLSKVRPEVVQYLVDQARKRRQQQEQEQEQRLPEHNPAQAELPLRHER
jgi:hypothetical protein